MPRKMAKSSNKNISKSMSFRICVYPSQFDKRYFTAHCLELDVIGQDKTFEGAVSQLLEAIETQLEVCMETGAQLQFFAPPIVWHKYAQAKKANRKIPVELMERIIKQANRRLGYKSPAGIDKRIDSIVGTKEVMDECLAASA